MEAGLDCARIKKQSTFSHHFENIMKIKNFYSFTCAKQYFNKCSKDYICFLIEDHETDTYGVIDEDHLYHLQYEFDLHMTILYQSA